VDELFAFASQLGRRYFAGGIHGAGADPALINDVAQKHGVRWAFENHPEKSADEILARIGGGQYEHCGVALDTAGAARKVWTRSKPSRHTREAVHFALERCVASGGHDTCAPGDGVVNCEGVVRYLVETVGRAQSASSTNLTTATPMPEVITGLQRVQQWLQP
jgi:sugar phosphate isomerase/epimerase